MSDTPDWALVAQKLHQDCRQLERELAEVTKQRDELQAIVDEKCRISSLCRDMRIKHDQIKKNLDLALRICRIWFAISKRPNTKQEVIDAQELSLMLFSSCGKDQSFLDVIKTEGGKA